jgi:hypothetical protein
MDSVARAGDRGRGEERCVRQAYVAAAAQECGVEDFVLISSSSPSPTTTRYKLLATSYKLLATNSSSSAVSAASA